MTAAVPPVGNLLREWRQRRRLSQLDLACEAEISTRHLSFLETGRSLPSREMLLRLAEQLDVPIRERNVLLLSAGYAPVYSENTLGDPALDTARKAIDLMLESQKPYPAFALDRHWRIMASNGAIPQLYAGVAASLLQPPINALRLTLHPEGLAPQIANLVEWRAHLLARLRRQIQVTADPTLTELLRELSGYPLPGGASAHSAANESAVAVPFKIHTEAGLLSFFSMTTIFGTPLDITLSELALEFFLPIDAATVEAVRALAA
jgi:transcriptional regulator with XRE-family HTH domain